MSRSSRAGSSLIFDPEIEKTAKKLRKKAKLRKKQSESTSLPVVNIWEDIELSTDSESDTELHFEEDKPRTQKEKPVTETQKEEPVTETEGEAEEDDMANPEHTLRE